MNSRAMLLKRLQVCDFVLTEVGLFLDTHPNDKEALAYYHKYLDLKQETQTEFTRRFGTVSRYEPKNSDTWDWVDNPWPWDNSEG